MRSFVSLTSSRNLRRHFSTLSDRKSSSAVRSIGLRISNGRIFTLLTRTTVDDCFDFRCSSSSSSSNASTSSVRTVDLERFVNARIRNFSIVAHVDHGKSTLADRLMELTHTVEKGSQSQLLDKLQVERERGITVKAQTVSMLYQQHHVGQDQDYLLNLIDTPGHADFSYELRRALAASDGVLLLVDATQGVQAQTVANFWAAFELDLPIVPVLNKIDMKAADVELCAAQLNSLFEIPPEQCLKVSAALGDGVDSLLEAIVERIPPPKSAEKRDEEFSGLIFDSWHSGYSGVVAMVRLKSGVLKKGQTLRSVHSDKLYKVKRVGIMSPEETEVEALFAGQVGFVVTDMRSIKDAVVGDTLTTTPTPTSPLMERPTLAFSPPKPLIFAGLFPMDAADYDTLSAAMEKLTLNDPSVRVENDSSPALGQGWRVGFLGTLHMEVFGQRLEQEYDSSVVMTSPSVTYKVVIHENPTIRRRYDNQGELLVSNPEKFPEFVKDIKECLEPIIRATILTPSEYEEKLTRLCRSLRGSVEKEVRLIDGGRTILEFEFPLAEMMADFSGRIKGASSGYASFDYENVGYKLVELVRLNVLINDKPVEEFSLLCDKSSARKRGQHLCAVLAKEIPPQQYLVKIQAAVGKKVLVRENIKPLSKDLKQKVKGNMAAGRYEKLRKHQLEGKRRLRVVANVPLPKQAFFSAFKYYSD